MADATPPTIKDAIKALAQAVPGVLIRYEGIKENTAELLKFFRQLRDANSQINELLKILQHLEDDLNNNAIPSHLENLQMDSIKSGGYLYSLAVRTFANITIEQRPKAYEWLKENGYEAIIQPTVNAKTLSSVITNHIVEKGTKPPEDAINIHQKKYISVRKS